MKDPIVEEVRKARQDHAKKFNYDLAAICNDLKRVERQQYGHRLVSFPPKLLTRQMQPTIDQDRQNCGILCPVN